MDRNLYLELCQKVSVLQNSKTGANIPDNLKVVHNGQIYIPVAYELSFKNGEPQHRAVLRDLCSNSITYTKLERVKNYDR
jgi:hypothetical protein